MSGAPRPRVVVIGVGNDDRGDDAAGLLVARRVRAAAAGRVEVIESDGSITGLLESWSPADHVILVDAVPGPHPGRCQRLDAAAAATMRSACSSHGLGAGQAIALASVLGALPASLVVHAVEGSDFTRGAPVSAAVDAACTRLARRILAAAPPLITPLAAAG